MSVKLVSRALRCDGDPGAIVVGSSRGGDCILAISLKRMKFGEDDAILVSWLVVVAGAGKRGGGGGKKNEELSTET